MVGGKAEGVLRLLVQLIGEEQVIPYIFLRVKILLLLLDLGLALSLTLQRLFTLLVQIGLDEPLRSRLHRWLHSLTRVDLWQ